MSAYVVSPDTMNRVVSALIGRDAHEPIIRCFGGLDTDKPDVGTEIGRRLFTLNIEAVMQRYPDCDDHPENMPGTEGCATLSDKYVFLGEPRQMKRAEWIASYKALRNLFYQCSEGDIPNVPLFKELVAAITCIGHHIISGLPEYDAAHWD